MKTIYLANCLGFDAILRPVLDNLVRVFTEAGFSVIEPFADCAATIDFAKHSTSPVALAVRVAHHNMNAICSCDVMVAVIAGNGKSVDDGIAWEMGYAAGKGKEVCVLDTRDIEPVALNYQLYGGKMSIHHTVEQVIEAINY